jgi:hypothetical protein
MNQWSRIHNDFFKFQTKVNKICEFTSLKEIIPKKMNIIKTFFLPDHQYFNKFL